MSGTLKSTARIAAFTFVMSAPLNAQAAGTQKSVPIRELAPPDAISADRYGTILGVHPLADDRLLIDDGGHRQLIVVDARLANKTVIIDSVAIDGQSYGRYSTPIIPYLGDSVFFVDGAARTLLLITPQGTIGRAASAPKASDFSALSYMSAGADARGNLIYRGTEPVNYKAPPVNGIGALPKDSAPIVRANFETRTVDTLTRVKLQANTRFTSEKIGDEYVVTQHVNPLTSVDEWSVLSDGTVALVRGHDYHVDIVRPDGARVAGPKLPFDWKKLSDADKQMLIDSTRRARETRDSIFKSQPLTIEALTRAGRPVSASQLMAAQRGEKIPPGVDTQKLTEVGANEIADYWPPIRAGATKADLDANLWILPTTSAQSVNGELVYDVVNNRGELMERVRIPLGKSIAGFGRGGVVYLMSKDADGWALERTRVIQ